MNIGEAIRHAYGTSTQADLAAALGVTQGAVSKWVRGDLSPSLEQLAAIEVATGRPRGFILRCAGFVEDVTTVESALLNDPAISDDSRDLLMIAYRGAVERRNSNGH